MNKRSRAKTAYINSTVTLVSQMVQILFGFIIRKLFIRYLGVNYLGYNSVFQNILQMLNLAELGIGVAITSYLYQPLAEGNREKVSSIMFIYKKIYSIIGVIVLGIGIIASFFLEALIPDAICSILYLRMLFYINLIGTVSTYFLAYKRTLIIADQRSYITNIYDMIIYIVVSLLQMIVLILRSNYIVYLLLNIIKSIVSNIIISLKSDSIYGNILDSTRDELITEYTPQIYQYVKDIFVSRIGSLIYYSTDNLILSVLKGSLLTGYLSNYTLVTTQLNTVVGQILSSLQATFGNYINTHECLDDQKRMTDNYFCVNYLIGNFCLICFSLLAQPFVGLIFGQNMLLEYSTVLWLGINLMLTFLIQLPSQIFAIYKLYRYDRPIIIVSASFNIIISIVLVQLIGVDGVLIGTFITSLIYLFSRFYIISKFVYKISCFHYLKCLTKYSLFSLISFFTTYLAVKNINGNSGLIFGIKAILVGVIALFSTVVLLSFTKEFDILISKLIPTKAQRFFKKLILIIMLCFTLILTFLIGRKKTERLSFTDLGNKSYESIDTYICGENTGKGIFHLSFDDTIDVFKNLTQEKPESIFNNNILSWYKDIHDKYGVVISSYVYYECG